MSLNPGGPATNAPDGGSAAKGALVAAIRTSLPNPPARIGVGVSGGSDSLALLIGVYEAFRKQDVKISVATVNHGLRAEAEHEAEAVARFAQKLGVEHDVLTWEPPAQLRNLQSDARNARFDLLSNWAQQKQIPVVALGHTADDQAETVIMRMKRESGVDGLSGIPERRTVGGVEFRRPLLSLRREKLREVLRAEGVDWIDDPSNDNDRFERVRTRKALAVLEDLGLCPTAFSTVAENMSQARKALEWYSFLAAREVFDTRFGAVVIQRRAFRVLPVEIAHRLLAAAFQWLTGNPYVPRRQAMVDARTVVGQGGSYTVAGCRVLVKSSTAWIFREMNAVRSTETAPGQLWDGRWVIFGGVARQRKVRMLGLDGLQQCPDWRALECPREVLQSTPAVWCDQKLVAAPVAGFANEWSATLTRSGEALYTSFLTH